MMARSQQLIAQNDPAGALVALGPSSAAGLSAPQLTFVVRRPPLRERVRPVVLGCTMATGIWVTHLLTTLGNGASRSGAYETMRAIAFLALATCCAGPSRWAMRPHIPRPGASSALITGAALAIAHLASMDGWLIGHASDGGLYCMLGVGLAGTLSARLTMGRVIVPERLGACLVALLAVLVLHFLPAANGLPDHGFERFSQGAARVPAIVAGSIVAALVTFAMITRRAGLWSPLGSHVLSPRHALARAPGVSPAGRLPAWLDPMSAATAAMREAAAWQEASSPRIADGKAATPLIRQPRQDVDALTGTVDRASFIDLVAARLSGTGADVAMLCLDLDRFQSINDRYGYRVGDAVLVEVATRLRSCLAPDDVIARIGGDRFAILRDAAGRPTSPAAFAGEVMAAVVEPLSMAGHRLQLGASIGIALASTGVGDAYELIARTELALDAARRTGGGSVRFFDEAMSRDRIVRQVLADGTETALAEGQFRLVCQPIIAMTSRHVIGCEALLRWNHPVLGPIAPDCFIPIAEQTGAIRILGEWVLRQACREAAEWANPLWIAVNVSPLQLDDDLVPAVSRILREEGLSADRLIVEVTEGVFIHERQTVLDAMNGLRALGVRLSLDDFGTGYSSLSYIRRFSFSHIKIDRSFIRDMVGDAQASTIVRTVIGLARDLSIDVVAEGVETQQQLGMLAAMGCRAAQGFLIGRPAPMGDFATLVERISPGSPSRLDGHSAAAGEAVGPALVQKLPCGKRTPPTRLVAPTAPPALS